MDEAMNITNLYMRMLAPLSDEVKLDLIHRLSASLLRKKSKSIAIDNDLFAGITGAWNDDVSPEEEAKHIRESRRSGSTRTIKEW